MFIFYDNRRSDPKLPAVDFKPLSSSRVSHSQVPRKARIRSDSQDDCERYPPFYRSHDAIIQAKVTIDSNVHETYILPKQFSNICEKLSVVRLI